jgi:hypothetical protein
MAQDDRSHRDDRKPARIGHGTDIGMAEASRLDVEDDLARSGRGRRNLVKYQRFVGVGELPRPHSYSLITVGPHTV